MAVADASFSTSIDWISLGSTDMSGLLFGSVEFEPCSAGRPSMTYRGSLLALIEPLPRIRDRKSTRLNSSHSQISYAVFCLKKKKKKNKSHSQYKYTRSVLLHSDDDT